MSLGPINGTYEEILKKVNQTSDCSLSNLDLTQQVSPNNNHTLEYSEPKSKSKHQKKYENFNQQEESSDDFHIDLEYLDKNKTENSD